MRALWLVLLLGCRSSPAPTMTAPPAIVLDDGLRQRVDLGIPVAIELRARDAVVGGCTLSRDVWAEVYRARVSAAGVVADPDLVRALRHCLDAPTPGPVVAREVPASASPVH